MQINKPKNLKSAGFTLIELLIVIIIIGILAAIGFIAYTGAQTKAKKADAVSTLSQLRSKLAEYNAENDTYPASKDEISTYLRSDEGGNNKSLADKFNGAADDDSGNAAKYDYECAAAGCDAGYTLTAQASLWGGTDGTGDEVVHN